MRKLIKKNLTESSKPAIKKHFEVLYVFSFLTIIVSLFALNRMCGGLGKDIVCYGYQHYVIRNILEHFITGIYIPLFALFVGYTGRLITQKLNFIPFSFMTKKQKYLVVVFGSALYILCEAFYQFIIKYNSSSIYQFIFELLGIGLMIYVLYRDAFFND